MNKIDDEKEIKLLNQVGNRIKWCREKLELSQKKVAEENKISRSTYCERENGMRATCHEEYLALANYFNHEWKKKFSEQVPTYEGRAIKKVLVIWILYGILEE